MAIARGAHLVGGLAAPTAEEAMRQTSAILGRHLTRLTDGETGARSQWIGWQIDKLLALPGIRMGEPQINHETGNADYSVFPGLDVDPGTSIPPRTLGYADAAIDSYRVFQALRAEGVIPADVRFQVSVPTPYAVAVTWVSPSSQAAFFDTYKAALLDEIADICGAIPLEDLAIQWDVAVEIGVLEGVFRPTAELATPERGTTELRACVDAVPDPAAVGLHLCYGDYKHRHFKAPTDLSLPVRIANAVAATSKLDFIHMPVDRDTGLEPGYFAPLADLRVGDAELALGVIDYENDSARIDALVAAAARSTDRPFAVATECGMSRLGERGESVTLEDLLRQHVRVAEPIR